MIRIAIVDDEENVLNYIHSKVSQISTALSIECTIEVFTDGTSMLKRNSANSFHIVLLDLEMPKTDGLHIAKLMRENYSNIALIFVTNRTDLVFRSFEYDIVGFVRKSHLEKELKITLDRAYQKVLDHMTNYVFKTETGERIFTSDSICYFISNKHKIYLFDEFQNKTRILTTLEKLEDFLSPRNYIRCHSGIIVNCKYIYSIGQTSIVLINGETIPVSRQRVKSVKLSFHRYLRGV